MKEAASSTVHVAADSPMQKLMNLIGSGLGKTADLIVLVLKRQLDQWLDERFIERPESPCDMTKRHDCIPTDIRIRMGSKPYTHTHGKRMIR